MDKTSWTYCSLRITIITLALSEMIWVLKDSFCPSNSSTYASTHGQGEVIIEE